MKPILILTISFIAIAAILVIAPKFVNAPEKTGCTMEAKLCPDGSAVGRTGPNCEFAKCPSEKSIAEQIQECLPKSDADSHKKCEKLLQQITDYDSCVVAGFPIMKSNPPQCATPDGRNFTEKQATNGITGSVLLGPTCPVVQYPPDEKCADKPYATKLVVTTSDQAQVIKEFESNENGNFKVDLPPGEYAIRSVVAANILPYCSSNEFTVTANTYTEVSVSCDTGIR